MTNGEYKKLHESFSKPSPIVKNTAKAFAVGGLICTAGQVLFYLYTAAGASETNAYTIVSVTLVGVSVILTALDLYDSLAKFGGAGTLVPITGFANAVASPAIDCKAEGFVLGVGAKMFTVSGSVILYGTVASVIYGLFLAIF